MLIDSVNQMLEMAEWFKAKGDLETYRNIKSTCNKVLDFILYTAQERAAHSSMGRGAPL